MADTRKDKRAPISLKVRFKSATLDEFIEQYSVDISRGGIFIKSKTPMSVGTLLKFEFRLKDESRLIHGVGRVIWKREEDGGDDSPPGMGIKFIKMDPESRALVDQMVAKRGEAPGRFEQGQEGDVVASAPAASFFPTTPEPELPPPEDRTQVRHASEFLASALAGGASETASKEAEKRAAEARKRTEEIERQRAEAAKQPRKPRNKKTLVGVGIPEAESGEPPAVEAQPIAASTAAVDAEVDDAVEKAAQKAFVEPERERPLAEAGESAETEAIDREELEAAKALSVEPKTEKAEDEPETAAPEAAEPEKDAPETAAKGEAAAAPPPAEDSPEAAEPEKQEPKAAAEPKKEEPKKQEPKAAAEPKKPKPRAGEPKKEERRPVAQPAQPAPPEEQPSKMPMIAFVAILLLGVGAFVAHQMGVFGGGEPAPTPPSISRQPSTDPTPTRDTPPADPSTEPADPSTEPAAGDPGAEGEGIEGTEGANAAGTEGANAAGTEGANPEGTEGAGTEGDDALAAGEEAPAVPTVTVQITTTPAGATVRVGGVEQGASPASVELPVGVATTVAARMAGYVEASQEVTATERAAPVRLTLQAMPYVIQVVTDPPGAVVRGGSGSATSPGDLTLRRAPTAPVRLTASMRGYQNAERTLQPSDFAESEGRMVARVRLTLERSPTPTPRARPTGGGGGGAPAGGGDAPASSNEGRGTETGGGRDAPAPAPAPAPARAPAPAPAAPEPSPPPAPAPATPSNPF